jgi:hypothetical protein
MVPKKRTDASGPGTGSYERNRGRVQKRCQIVLEIHLLFKLVNRNRISFLRQRFQGNLKESDGYLLHAPTKTGVIATMIVQGGISKQEADDMVSNVYFRVLLRRLEMRLAKINAEPINSSDKEVS